MIDRVITVLSLFLAALRRVVPVACCAIVLSCAFGDEDAIESLYGKSDNPLFIAVGGDGTGKVILASPNGRIWSGNLVSGGGVNFLNVAGYGDGLFLSVAPYDSLAGAYNFYVSPDGLLWSRNNTGSDAKVTDIMFSKGLFLAPGMDLPGNSSAIWASVDGLFFFDTYAPAVPGQTFRGIAYGNGRFVAVGDNIIAVSQDGLVWSSNLVSVPTFAMYDVAYGGVGFVAVGESGMIMVSPDGMAWSPPFYVHPSCGVDPCHLNAVVYDSGKFVAVGDQLGLGAIFVSLDGLIWTNNVYGDVAMSLVKVAGCNGTFIAVTGMTDYARSGDGISWSTETFSGGPQIQGVACRP
ncbi:MAG: hypothetical protein JW838_10735 [Spirochaetes bacterium]|nr:hypothetical protein [Spirochaetota bacterium]